jgi:enoyl-CoA hydratase/carnithine racemase
MPNTELKFTKKDYVAYITLNRPEAGNSINQPMAEALTAACDQINQDKEIRTILISGAGSSFCTGNDLAPGDPGYNCAEAIASIRWPVIAAINGDAAGPGLELALACDIRLASTTARFALPQIEKGELPMEGGTQRLARIAGRGKALEMLLTAEAITAEEALQTGMVSQVLPKDKLTETAEQLARNIAAKGPVALQYMKEAVNKGLDMTLEQGLRLEADLYFLIHTTQDRAEGIRSFLNKQPPKFTGT